MILRIIGSIVGFAIAVVMISLAVANRHPVALVLDPFKPQRPAISLELPFYAYLLGMLILGIVLGGLATWLSQGRWRRQVRIKTQEAVRWRAEADRLVRERDAGLIERTQADKGSADKSRTDVAARRQLAVTGS